MPPSRLRSARRCMREVAHKGLFLRRPSALGHRVRGGEVGGFPIRGEGWESPEKAKRKWRGPGGQTRGVSFGLPARLGLRGCPHLDETTHRNAPPDATPDGARHSGASGLGRRASSQLRRRRKSPTAPAPGASRPAGSARQPPRPTSVTTMTTDLGRRGDSSGSSKDCCGSSRRCSCSESRGSRGTSRSIVPGSSGTRG